MKKYLHLLMLSSVLAALLTACDKDNTPLPTPLAKMAPTEISVNILWHNHTSHGAGNHYLFMGSSLHGTTLASAGYDGNIVLINATNGQTLKQITTHLAISATPALNDTAVFVATLDGKLAAFDLSGKALWQIDLPSSVLTPPVADNDIVVVACHNGNVLAYDAKTGSERWFYSNPTPALSLEKNAAPLLNDHLVIAGFASGQAAALDATNGNIKWQQPIALPSGTDAVTNMVDIDGTAAIDDGNVYLVAYHGNIAAINLSSGNTLWQKPASSYETIAVKNGKIICTSDEGVILALDETTGATLWQQDALKYRFVSAPNIINNTVVVGDYAGYVHFLSLDDGHLLARVQAGSAAINTQPLVTGNQVIVTLKNGEVVALAPSH